MTGLSTKEKRALNKLKVKLRKNFAQKIVHFFVFGSKARGDAGVNSDIDILIILDSTSWEEKQKVVNLAYEVMLDYNIKLSPLILFYHDWQKYLSLPTSFSFLVQKEAISLL